MIDRPCLGLASVDSILLVTSILLFVIPSFYTFTENDDSYYIRYIHPVITPYTFVLATTAQTSSVYLTVTVTVERYIAVCHPLRARSWCTCKRGRLAVIVIALLSLCYNLPRFLEVDYCLQVDHRNNQSWTMVTFIFSMDSPLPPPEGSVLFPSACYGAQLQPSERCAERAMN